MSLRVTEQFTLPDWYCLGVKLSTPSLVMLGPAMNILCVVGASLHSMLMKTGSPSSPAPAEISVAHVSSKGAESASTVMGEGPGLKLGGSFTASSKVSYHTVAG